MVLKIFYKNRAKAFEIPSKACVEIPKQVSMWIFKFNKKEKFLLNNKIDDDLNNLKYELINKNGTKEILTVDRNAEFQYYTWERYNNISYEFISGTHITIGISSSDKVVAKDFKLAKSLVKGDLIRITLYENTKLYTVINNNLILVDGALEIEVTAGNTVYQRGNKIYVDPNRQYEVCEILEYKPFIEKIK